MAMNRITGTALSPDCAEYAIIIIFIIPRILYSLHLQPQMNL